jgi:hypothetical protein
MRRFSVPNSQSDGSNHRSGDSNCPQCWDGHPHKCKCGGLIHCEYDGEDPDGLYRLACVCDVCGPDYEEEECTP